MTSNIDHAAAWMYRGVWGVLTRWFRVPQHPPTLPVLAGEKLQSFRPSEGYLRYLKLQFWLSILPSEIFIVVGWSSIMAASTTARRPWIGILAAPAAILLATVPQLLAYLGLHLRYDTTWYVLSQRSLRIRSGIWTIHEATITFENIQNVTVESGPIERIFGIGNVIVDTAGGSAAGGEGHGKGTRNLHRGEIAGVADAAEIRQLILSRLSLSKVAGLGDEESHASQGWTSEHVFALREIRDSLRVQAGK
jgi:membrane protein YdbS with pleckstrin-like domain